MQYISSTDARNNLSAILEQAQRGPVTVQKQGRDVAVVLSRHDYERITKANRECFLTFCEEVAQEAREKGLTEEKLNELLADDDE